MDTDKVIQDLNRRFAALLPEFYQRRIIFWYDEDKEFEDKLDEVVLENAKIIALTGNNAFSVKKLLSVDDLTTNYLVYSPLAYNRPDDNWLLDVELYSEEFRADLISIWMDEMGLTSNPAMRKQVKNYRAYFNAKDRRLKVSTQNKVPATPAQLHMAVMAAICGLKDAQPNMIFRSVFRAGLDLKNNTVYQDFVKYHVDGAFWTMVRQGCGFVEEEPDLGRLAIHLLLTAATVPCGRNISPDWIALFPCRIRHIAMILFPSGCTARIFSSYMMWHGMLKMKPVCISVLKS